MLPRNNKKDIALRALILVFLVIFVCLWQQAGFSSTCTLSADSYNTHDSQGLDNDGEQPCHLSEQLLHTQSINLEQCLLLFPIILFMLRWLATQPGRFHPYTEPIPSTRRPHLVLCVFHE